MERKLQEIASKLKSSGNLRVGFLENATYPNGTSVALVAAIQNFGAPKVGIPPRPFFSNMVREKSGGWPDAIAKNLKATGMDVRAALERVGEGIKGQLQQSIIQTNSPPLAQSTIDRKGSAKPLVDTGHMLASVDYEVTSK